MGRGFKDVITAEGPKGLNEIVSQKPQHELGMNGDEKNIFSVPITIPTSSCPPRGPCGNHTSSPVSTSLFTFSGDSANFKSSFNIAQYNASGDHIMTPPSSTDGAPFCLPAPHHCAINKCLFL